MQRVLQEHQLQELYSWVDQIPLSRPKRNMARDFSDAVLVAEIIHHHFPKLIELHNYADVGSLDAKLSNWKTLNDKVLRKIKISLTADDMQALAVSQPGQAERLLFLIHKYIREQPEQSFYSRVTKSKADQMLVPTTSFKNRQKTFTFKEIKKDKDVQEVLECKDNQIELLKETIELFALKFSKLEQVVKSKDKQIDELVKKIKTKGVI